MDNGWMDEWFNKLLQAIMIEWMNWLLVDAWMNKWVDGWMNEWMNEWAYEWVWGRMDLGMF